MLTHRHVHVKLRVLNTKEGGDIMCCAVSWRPTRQSTAAAVAAVALMAASAQTQAEEIEILFPTSPTTFAIPHYVAQEKGYYAEQGLKVKDTHLLGDANAFRALVGGEGDAVLVGPSTTMNGILKGADVKAFASWQPRVDYQLVTAKDKSANMDEGLVGLRFAGAGGASMLNHMLAMILEKHGLDSSKNANVSIGGHSDRVAALIGGKADMTMVNTLTASQAGDQINVVTPVATELGGIGYVYLVAREETLKDPERREALKKFVKGSILGARETLKDPEFAAEALHKRAPEMSLPLIKTVVQELNEIPVWGVNGGIPNEVTEFTADAYLKYDVISKKIAPDQVLYRGLVDEVLDDVGRYEK
jgi:NitT/TauT family transport system substrate-binding protein